MSKNVAVFVDVANIFYAAKAAGVDIDYVTLLKSATAGRDFVRAYAYTGLDPENENQRQFHSFLARSGYKVVSKDIRKYGDGRIKANLDIELVVDLMRMADHIDIAVVISGDGDFAPAIRAVQQMGVRVEVISFRGNTSSDLIDVADVFTDIAHIARVEKGARSGRRVAAEDDLSMTEVPDKETDLAPRRRRGRRGEGEERRPAREPARETVPAAQAAGADAPGLVVLPGERLSRVAPEAAAPAVPQDEETLGEGAGEETGTRRRRRRRGGRGRGRRPDEVATATGAELADELAEEEFLAEEVPTLPQHSAFGSVWDSQIGLPTSARGDGDLEDEGEIEDEPAIPEYLLAERRQQGRRRGTRGRGGRQAGYQSAVDRERYGRGAGGYAGGGPRTTGRSGYGGTGTPGRGPRPVQPAAPRSERTGGERPSGDRGPVERPSAEPWSEVPPEVQELLRAELARRQASGTAQAPRPVSGEVTEPALKTSGETAPPSRSRRTRRAPASAEAAATAEVRAATEPGEATVEPAAVVSATPTTRRRTTRKAAPTASPDEAEAATSAAASSADAGASEGGSPTTSRRRRSTSSSAAAQAPAGDEAAPEASAADAAAAPSGTTSRRRSSRTKASAAESEA